MIPAACQYKNVAADVNLQFLVDWSGKKAWDFTPRHKAPDCGRSLVYEETATG
jgi:hypothetical protein